jgi:transcriptional regulator with XRE-family HTH domain
MQRHGKLHNSQQVVKEATSLYPPPHDLDQRTAMNPIKRHIENAISAGKIKNKAEVATRLKIQRSTVTRWCDGSSAPSAEEARALAELIGMPPGILMAECEAERAKDKETRAEWHRVARFLRSAASTTGLMVLLGVTLFVTGTEKALAESMTYAADNSLSTNYRRF